MKKAFALLELFAVIALSGVMAFLSLNYFNFSTLSQINIKTQIQSHLSTITATILQCKTLSNQMPLQPGGAFASATLLDTLECNTSTPYALDGGKGSFIPPPLSGFSTYTATQNGTEFYFATTALKNSRNDEVLQALQSTYSSNQYVLTHDATTAYLKFYLSR